MSRRDNMKRIFVGNLPPDVRHRDLEDLFHKYGQIAFIDLKTKRGPPFAFVEFTDYRDAEDAVKHRDGRKFDGNILRVEFPRGRERTSKYRNGSASGSGSRSAAPQRRSKYRVTVKGLPPSGSWQDLKDHMREFGEVCFADVYKGGEGVVEFLNHNDMRYAIRELNNTKFKSHEGETSYITLREDKTRGYSRSRSRSPVQAKRRGSPSYSPAKRRASHSVSRSRSRSRSPVAQKRRASHSVSRSRSRSRSKSPSRSRSRSRSRTPVKKARRTASRSVSKSRSRSKSPARSASSRSAASRSPSPKQAGDRSPSKSASSRSASPQQKQRSPSRSPSKSRSPTPDDKAE